MVDRQEAGFGVSSGGLIGNNASFLVNRGKDKIEEQGGLTAYVWPLSFFLLFPFALNFFLYSNLARSRPAMKQIQVRNMRKTWMIFREG